MALARVCARTHVNFVAVYATIGIGIRFIRVPMCHLTKPRYCVHGNLFSVFCALQCQSEFNHLSVYMCAYGNRLCYNNNKCNNGVKGFGKRSPFSHVDINTHRPNVNSEHTFGHRNKYPELGTNPFDLPPSKESKEIKVR